LIALVSSCVSNRYVTDSQWHDEINVNKMTLYSSEFVIVPQTNMLLHVSNNDKFVQFQIKMNDPSTVQKVMMNGFQLWLDTTGKQKQQLGIIFPSARTAMKGTRPESGKPLDPSILVNAINMLGMNVMENGVLKPAGKQVALVFIDKNNDINYLINIPFSLLGVSFTRIKALSIGLISEHQSQGRPQAQGPGESQANGESLGGGHQEGGGGFRGAGANGTNTQGNATLHQPIRSWISISLSNPVKKEQ